MTLDEFSTWRCVSQTLMGCAEVGRLRANPTAAAGGVSDKTASHAIRLQSLRDLTEAQDQLISHLSVAMIIYNPDNDRSQPAPPPSMTLLPPRDSGVCLDRQRWRDICKATRAVRVARQAYLGWLTAPDTPCV